MIGEYMRRIINICFIGVFGALMIFPFLLADKAGGGDIRGRKSLFSKSARVEMA